MPTTDEIKAQMAANSLAWHQAATQTERDRLKAENQRLGGQIGGTYTSSTGVWSFDNSPKQTIAYTGVAAMAAKTAVGASVGGDTARAKREAERNKFTGWDNDPAVRSLQEVSWAIYVDTGRWDTAEQKELHKQAEKIRQYNNPMYEGLPWGPGDWLDAEKITPRDTTPDANGLEAKMGSYLKASLGAIAVIFAISLFRR
ncbi:hypothetical protein ACFQZE_24440 [Paenibacillus sp. GCM10027627]|uniref:hypothetical protein n=1 Tax=unclassified Paenibacillus TaxID=185978 RepID=UPI0036325CA3